MKAYPWGFMAVFWWVLGASFVSGLLLTPGLLELRLGWEVPASVRVGSRVWWAALHALSAFAALLVFGALAPLHIRNGLRRRTNFASGMSVLVVFAILAFTGWAIYYVSHEQLSVWASVIHLVIGLLAAIALTVHVMLAKRVQAQSMVAQGSPLHRLDDDVSDPDDSEVVPEQKQIRRKRA